MYTIECKDPNCVKCKQAYEGQSSQEENRCKIPETVEQVSQEESQKKHLEQLKEVLANDLHSAVFDRKIYLSICRRLKKQVHCEFNTLVNILREREQNLCIEIERDYDFQLQKIDENIAASCADKILKRNDENKSPAAETTLSFNSDFDYLRRKLMCYGQLKYKDNDELNKKWIQGTVNKYSQFQAGTGDALSSGSSSQLDFIPSFRGENATLVSSTSPVEVNHEKLKWELEEQRLMIKKTIPNFEDLKMNFYCGDSEIGLTYDDLYGASGRIGSANNVSELSYNNEDSDGRLFYDAYRLREIISHLNDREYFAPAVAEVLFRECEYFKDDDALSACLRDLTLALKRSAKPAMRHRSEGHLVKKYNDLELENLALRNRIKSLENELMLSLQNIEKKGCKTKTLQQLTRKDEPEALSAQIKKRYEVLANETIKAAKREKMACQSFKSADSAPDKEVKISESPEKCIKEIVEKFAVTDLKSKKITSQSSENTDSSMSEEVDKDSSLDEDDIEIISRQETESIPSELPVSPLPSKNRFEFVGKTSRVASLLQKKLHIPKNDASKSQKKLLDSCNSNIETKENQSFNEKPHQKPSSACFDISKDIGQDNDPTVALRSSFIKYLKNPGSEWLAPVKSSELSKPAENSCVERNVPIFVQEMDHWRPIESKEKMASDWLHPARM